MGSAFIADLVDFLKQHLTENAELEGGFVIVGQSRKLKPHKFFEKKSFGPMPKQF